MATATATLRYLKIPPRKARAVVDTIRGCSVNDAEARLMVSPNRSGAPILKLLRSALANAKQNAKLDPAKLVIAEIRVDQGPKTRRWTPRARGSGALIERKSCHVSITLAEAASPKQSRYVIAAPVAPVKDKKRKRVRDEKETKAGEDEKHVEGGPAPKAGKAYLKRVFRRKSV